MARALDATLDSLILNAEHRRPAYEILIYDIRSTEGDPNPTLINDIVKLNNPTPPSIPTIVGPLEFTPFVDELRVTETSGDYTKAGVAASSLAFTVPLANETEVFDPLSGEDESRWLRQRNVVVLREGDQAVDREFWPITFTGSLVGQPGYSNTERGGAPPILDIVCVGREVGYLRQTHTSDDFPEAVTLTTIVNSLATDMGLDPIEELDMPNFDSWQSCHTSLQFVDESLLTSMSRSMFPLGYMPRFLGNGKLGASDGVITKTPVRVYSDDAIIKNVNRPRVDESGERVVRIKGLSCEMSEQEQEEQALATANITMGFWASSARIKVSWSDDGSMQARDARLRILTSINDGLIPFGSEDFLLTTIQSDGGSTDGVIAIDVLLALKLLVTVGAILGAFSIPDHTTLPGAPTTPVGSIIQGGVLTIVNQLLLRAGNGQYEIVGRPFEYIFKEVVGVAQVKGDFPDEENELIIENHMITSQSMANEVAVRELKRMRAKVNLRNVDALHDLKLEPDDVFEDAQGSRYFITSINRTIGRSFSPRAQYTCFETTQGVIP